MDPATVGLGATLGALESLLGGCTTQLDMYVHHEAAHRGAVAAGSRHVGGPVFFDGPGPDRLEWSERIALLEAWPGQVAADGGPEVPVAAMPHSTYTCSPGHLAEVARILRDGRSRAARPAGCSPPTSPRPPPRTPTSRSGTAAPRPRSSADAGWLTGDLPVVAAHGVHLDDDDLRPARRRRRRGGPLPGLQPQAGERRRCPGAPPATAASLLGLGTDGCSSSNDLDMWQAMRQAALLARLTSGRPDVASAHEVVRAATRRRRPRARHRRPRRQRGARQACRPRRPRPRPSAPHAGARRATPCSSSRPGGPTSATSSSTASPVVRDRRSTRVDQAALLAAARERGADRPGRGGAAHEPARPATCPVPPRAPRRRRRSSPGSAWSRSPRRGRGSSPAHAPRS